MADRILSQYEIDDVFRTVREPETTEATSKKALLYDFRRPERLAKDQLQTINLVHENFARSVGSSLSAFLRSHIVPTFISVEQLSFSEFVGNLPAASCLVSLGMHPHEDAAILQIDRPLIFVILEMLLGGCSKTPAKIDRDTTEIERGILDSLFRIVLQDLRSAWQSIGNIDFFVQSHVSEPQLMQMFAQDEGILVVSIEVKIGENGGLMHLAFPSLLVKKFRDNVRRPAGGRKRDSNESDHARVMQRIQTSQVELEARLAGPKVSVNNLMNLQVGDVLSLNHQLTKELDLMLNGKSKFLGRIVTSGAG